MGGGFDIGATMKRFSVSLKSPVFTVPVTAPPLFLKSHIYFPTLPDPNFSWPGWF